MGKNEINRVVLYVVYRFGPTALTATNEEGIEKVRREKFAFILPDTIGDYVARRKPCDLVTVARFLDRRGYAIALQKNSRLVGLSLLPLDSAYGHVVCQ